MVPVKETEEEESSLRRDAGVMKEGASSQEIYTLQVTFDELPYVHPSNSSFFISNTEGSPVKLR